MTDIVERLRSRTTESPYGPVHNALDLEAADEIERLWALLRQAANEIDELGFPSKADAFLRALEGAYDRHR